MARKGRFTEARVYVAGGSLALLLGVWGLLAAQDAHSRADQAEAQQSSSIEAPQTSVGTHSDSRVQSAVRPAQPTPKPHSRTRGS